MAIISGLEIALHLATGRGWSMRTNVMVFSMILSIWLIVSFYATTGVSEHRPLTETVDAAQAPRLVQSNPVVQRLTPEFLARANSRIVIR